MDYKKIKILQKLKELNEDCYNNFISISTAYDKQINCGTLISSIGYTPHDVDTHCKNIYRILDDILPKSFYEIYKDGEDLFVLAVAVLLHDIAMSRDSGKTARQKHSKIAKDIILEEVYSINDTVLKAFVSRDLSTAIADVVYAHSDIKNDDDIVEQETLREIIEKYDEKGLDKGDYEILNVPFLAALLRLADELDLDYNRISSTGYIKKINVDSSKEHYINCEYFKKMKIDKRNPRELILEVDKEVYDKLTPDGKILASAKIIKTYDKVNKEFLKMKDSIFFNTNYGLEGWSIDKINLIDELSYRQAYKKKENL